MFNDSLMKSLLGFTDTIKLESSISNKFVRKFHTWDLLKFTDVVNSTFRAVRLDH